MYDPLSNLEHNKLTSIHFGMQMKGFKFFLPGFCFTHYYYPASEHPGNLELTSVLGWHIV